MPGLQVTDAEKFKSLRDGRKQMMERRDRSELNQPVLVRGIARCEHDFIYAIDIS